MSKLCHTMLLSLALPLFSCEIGNTNEGNHDALAATDAWRITQENVQLTQDHHGTIVIDKLYLPHNAAVTLDCNGHSIIADELRGAIIVFEVNNVTIKNCLISVTNPENQQPAVFAFANRIKGLPPAGSFSFINNTVYTYNRSTAINVNDYDQVDIHGRAGTNRISTEGGPGIEISHSNNVTIDGIHVEDEAPLFSAQEGIQVLYASGEVKVTGNDVNGYQTGVTIAGIPSHGPSKSITIQNNWFANNQRPIQIEADTTTSVVTTPNTIIQ